MNIRSVLRASVPAGLLSALLPAASGAALAPPPPERAVSFTPQQVAAAMRIDARRRQDQSLARTCAGRAGDAGMRFRFVALAFEADNLGLTLAAEHVLASRPAAPAGKDPAPGSSDCNAIERNWLSGTHTYARTTGADARAMQLVFAGQDALRIAKRNQDITVGCAKQSYNRGSRQFDATLLACQCQTRALLASGSDAQIDDWLADVGKAGDGGAATLQRAWIGEALAQAAKCATP